MDVLGAFDNWLEGVEDQMKEKSDPGRIASACEEATREIRQQIIQTWDYFMWYSTDAATLYTQNVSATGSFMHGMKVVVVTDSKVESGMFNPPTQKASYWRERHGGIGIDHREWILNLLFDQGIIGLPDWGDTMNYHPARKGNGTLESHFQNSGIWQSFESRVKSKI